MAYIPPHKRHSKGTEKPSQTPELLVPRFKRNLNLRSSGSKVDKSGKIIYANDAISRRCAVGLKDDNQFPSSVHLQPISLDHVEQKIGEKPLILVNSHINKDDNEVQGTVSRSPWVTIAENVQQDLLSSFEIVRNEMKCQELEEVKATLVARFGKILFHGSPSVSLKTVRKCQVAESTLRQLKRSFYTNVLSSYTENIVGQVAPEIGLDFEDEKDIYHVKLSDNTQPDATISCKCSAKEDKKLKLYKVELNQVRHMVVDISCLDKDLDLRLMLYTKRILTALSDDELHSIRDLINSAVLDPDVNGGLRWPLGKASSGDRYNVIGVWHTIATSYKSPSLRLKVRRADRFDFRTATGEATREITLKLKRIVSELQEKVEINSISDMLKNNLRLIWDHFLCFSEDVSSGSNEGSLALIPTSTPKAPEPPKFKMAGDSPLGSVTEDLQEVYLRRREFRMVFSQIGQALFDKFAPCPSRPFKTGVIITELTTDQQPSSASDRVTEESIPSLPTEVSPAEASQKVSSEAVANEASIIQVTKLPTAASLVGSTVMRDVDVLSSQGVSLTNEEQILTEAEERVPGMAVDHVEIINLDTLLAATPSPHIPRAQDVPAPPQEGKSSGPRASSRWWGVFQEAKVHADLVPFLEKAWGKHGAFVPIGTLQSNVMKSFIFEALGQILKNISITPLSALSDGRVERMMETVSDLKFCHCLLDWLDEPMQKLQIQVRAQQRLRDIGELDDLIKGMEQRLLEVKQEREDLLSENKEALQPFGGDLDLSKPSSEGLL